MHHQLTLSNNKKTYIHLINDQEDQEIATLTVYNDNSFTSDKHIKVSDKYGYHTMELKAHHNYTPEYSCGFFINCDTYEHLGMSKILKSSGIDVRYNLNDQHWNIPWGFDGISKFYPLPEAIFEAHVQVSVI